MHYKVFTNNGKFHIGYLFNITDIEDIRKYLIWEAQNQFDNEEINDDELEELKIKINKIDLIKQSPKNQDEETHIDGFVDSLYVTASNSSFPITDCDDFQQDSIGNSPW